MEIVPNLVSCASAISYIVDEYVGDPIPDHVIFVSIRVLKAAPKWPPNMVALQIERCEFYYPKLPNTLKWMRCETIFGDIPSSVEYLFTLNMEKNLENTNIKYLSMNTYCKGNFPINLKELHIANSALAIIILPPELETATFENAVEQKIICNYALKKLSVRGKKYTIEFNENLEELVIDSWLLEIEKMQYLKSIHIMDTTLAIKIPESVEKFSFEHTFKILEPCNAAAVIGKRELTDDEKIMFPQMKIFFINLDE